MANIMKLTSTGLVIADTKTITLGGNAVDDILISTDGASSADDILVTAGWIDANIVANPMTSNLNGGGYNISNLGDVTLASGKKFSLNNNVIIMNTGYTQADLVATISTLPSTGGTIILPSGICTFTSTMNVTKSVHFIGAGSGAGANGTFWTQSVSSNTYLVYQTGDATIYQGISFNNTGTTGSGLHINANLCRVLDCEFRSATYLGTGCYLHDAKIFNIIDRCYAVKYHLAFDCQSDYSKVINCSANDSDYGIIIQGCSYSIASNNIGHSCNTADVYGYNGSKNIFNNNICKTQMRMFSQTDSIWDGNVYNLFYTSGSYPNISCTAGSNELY